MTDGASKITVSRSHVIICNGANASLPVKHHAWMFIERPLC